MTEALYLFTLQSNNLDSTYSNVSPTMTKQQSYSVQESNVDVNPEHVWKYQKITNGMPKDTNQQAVTAKTLYHSSNS